MSRFVRKWDYCLCEIKGAVQLRSNCEADQHLCFRYMDNTIPVLLKSNFTSFLAASVAVQTGLCQTWSETLKTGFLASRQKNKSAAGLHDTPPRKFNLAKMFVNKFSR